MSTPDFRENQKFWQKFPGKNLNFSSRIPGNAYILAFLGVLSTKIPGNSRKGWPQISTKTKNCGRHFSGKNPNFVSRISRNPYILAFLHKLLTQIPGNSRRGVTNFGEFWRKLWISKNQEFSGNHNFFLDATFFVKYNVHHFNMSFLIVWTS